MKSGLYYYVSHTNGIYSIFFISINFLGDFVFIVLLMSISKSLLLFCSFVVALSHFREFFSYREPRICMDWKCVKLKSLKIYILFEGEQKTKENKTSSIAHYNLDENISSLYRDGIASIRIRVDFNFYPHSGYSAIHLAAFYSYNNSKK